MGWTISGAQGATISANGRAYIPTNTGAARNIIITYTGDNCTCSKVITQSGYTAPCNDYTDYGYGTGSATVGKCGGTVRVDSSDIPYTSYTCSYVGSNCQCTESGRGTTSDWENVTIGANTTSSVQTHTGTKGNISYTITQEAGPCSDPTPPGDCNCSGVSFTSSIEVTSEEGHATEGSYPIVCTNLMSYTAPDWATISFENGVIMLYYEKNSTSSERSGTITIEMDGTTCETATITQDAGTGPTPTEQIVTVSISCSIDSGALTVSASSDITPFTDVSIGYNGYVGIAGNGGYTSTRYITGTLSVGDSDTYTASELDDKGTSITSASPSVASVSPTNYTEGNVKQLYINGPSSSC